MASGIWLELVTLGALVWLGYIGARLASRFRLPSVTGFLLVGIALGPYGLRLLSLDLLHKIDFVNPLAMGLIVFLIGEELTARTLRRHHWSFWLIAILGVVIPADLVIWSTGVVRPGATAIAWILAAIAMSGAPATLMSVLAETKATGPWARMLLGVAAFSDIMTVVAYAAVTPFLLVSVGAADSLGTAGLAAGREILGAVALGIAFGYVLGRLIARTRESGELLALGLTHVLLVVAVAHTLGLSTLLAPLAMGITVAVIEEARECRGRSFNALRTIEYPVYIIFFTLAGADLNLTTVVEGGALMLAYIAARGIGKFAAGYFGSMAGGLRSRQAVWFGLGSLPQAGVAVGLALSATVDFPEIGPTVTAVVLASIVFFELVGPVAAKRALSELRMPEETPDVEIVGPTCRERTVLVPVSHHWSAGKLLHAIEATEGDSTCPSEFVLATVVTSPRGPQRPESMARAQAVLDQLEQVAANAGHLVSTRIVSARQIEIAIAQLAQEIGADLVVLGTPPTRAGRRFGSLTRTPLHRIVDRLETPVFIVPEGWEPREAGTPIESTAPAEEPPADDV